MPLIYQKVIKRSDLQANPKVLYVFGDNMARVGMGGQAAEMRGEPNAVGIPTKKAPHMGEDAFFTADESDYNAFFHASKHSFALLQLHLDRGGVVVWPSDDIGTGRAQLEDRAPRIWEFIQEWKEELSKGE